MLALFGGCVHLSAANSCCGVMVQGSPIRSNTMHFHQNISLATLNQSSLMDLLFHHTCFQRVRFTLWTRTNKPWPLAFSLPGTITESLTWHVRTATCGVLWFSGDFFQVLANVFFWTIFYFFLSVLNLPAGIWLEYSKAYLGVVPMWEWRQRLCEQHGNWASMQWRSWDVHQWAAGQVLRQEVCRPAFSGEHVGSYSAPSQMTSALWWFKGDL